MKILLKNATCKIEDAEDWVLDGIDDVLSYVNTSSQFAYEKTKRSIGRYTRLVEREKNLKILKSYKSKLKQLKFMLGKHDAERVVYLLDEMTNEFPSGALNRVLDWLDENEVYWELEDLRKRPPVLSKLDTITSLPDLRYYQKEACEAALEDERGIVVAPTGTGKTLKMIKMCIELCTTVLIITPDKNITANAYDSLIAFFGEDNVQRLKKGAKLKRINVCNIDTLRGLDPKIFEGLGACIIDEFHHAAADTYREININHLKDCYFRIGLTATNFRNSGDDLALEGVLSHVIYVYTIKQALEDGYLVKPEFRWINNRIKKAKKKYQEQYKESLVENEERNNEIVKICEKHKDDHVIVLVNQIKHLEILKKLMPWASTIDGKDKDADRTRVLNDFRKGNINVLIGTTVLGEGVDLPIANVLIMAGGGKARSKVIQNVGRVLRLYEGKDGAIIYDFQDAGAGFLEEHASLRKDVYNTYG